MGKRRGKYKGKKNSELPYCVTYMRDKFRVKYQEHGTTYGIGTYDTVEQAEYMATLGRFGHHWVGMQAGPYFGFTYLITNKRTGKRYVGLKQFYLWNGPVAGYKCTDMENEWWDAKAWRDNKWQEYTGSSIKLNNEIALGNVYDYKFEVLEMCRTKLDLHLAEVLYMQEHNVLEAVDEQGDYLWYNENIAGCEYRAPFRKCDVKEAAEGTMEAARKYYLKPSLMPDGSVIPFGHIPKTEEIVMPWKTGGFNDVR